MCRVVVFPLQSGIRWIAQLEQNFDVSVTAEQKNQPFLLEDGGAVLGPYLRI